MIGDFRIISKNFILLLQKKLKDPRKILIWNFLLNFNHVTPILIPIQSLDCKSNINEFIYSLRVLSYLLKFTINSKWTSFLLEKSKLFTYILILSNTRGNGSSLYMYIKVNYALEKIICQIAISNRKWTNFMRRTHINSGSIMQC